LRQELGTVLAPYFKKGLLSAGSALGGIAGGYLGNPSAGASAGNALAGKLSKLLGSGDYTTTDSVVQNSLFPESQRKSGNATASFSTIVETVRVKHREYIEDVFAGAVGFSIQGYPVNPGLSSVFQYLSSIAQNFEEYVFHGLVFEFVTTTSQYSSQPNVGSIIMAMQYDAALPPFTSKPQMENSDFAISAAPYKSIMYGVECANQAASAYYVRLDSNSNQPINLTDIGAFYVAIQNAGAYAAGSSLGELWVSYDIEFRRPHISPSRFGYAHAWYNVTGVSRQGAYLTMPSISAASQGNPGLVTVGSMAGTYITQVDDTSFEVNFPNANIGDVYLLVYSALLGAAVIGGAANISATTGLAPLNMWCSSTTNHAVDENACPTQDNSTVTGASNQPGTVSYATYTVIALEPAILIDSARTSSSTPGTTNEGLDLFVTNLGNGLSANPPYVI
jgi:hypothetical protein